MNYLINADFPQNLSAMLGERGTCVRLPFSNSIPLPVGAHPDTLIGKLGGELFVSANDAKIIKTLDANGVKYRISHHGTGAGYPLDCALRKRHNADRYGFRFRNCRNRVIYIVVLFSIV